MDRRGGGQHTRYFGHWLDDSKQNADATTQNMRAELCIDGDPNHLIEGLSRGGTVWKGTDGDAKSYRCGKSIYGQGILSAELGITIDAQVEAPGHGKWWLDRKTGSDKRYCQQCMCAINTPEEVDSIMKMKPAKWIDRNGVAEAVSPAAECVRMLSDPSRINGIKSEGMRAKQEGTALVERNDYAAYSMDDVPPIPDYKIELEKGKYNGIHAYYNIRTDPDLGIGWAALRHVACGCEPCKAQLKTPWVPRVDKGVQPRYARNEMCDLWPSYEGANDWRICQLAPKTKEDERGARDSNKCILNAMEVRISLMIREGEDGAVATTDEAAMGYYIVKWLSEPYSLQEDTEGMSGVIGASVMVADALFYNRVERAPYWYTRSRMTTVIEVRYVLKTGFEMDEISPANPLPCSCSRAEATLQKAKRVSILDHEAIMEEAERRDWLEYDDDDDEESDDNKSEHKVESDSDVDN